MKKVLLTGGTGFVGSNILRELSKSYQIYNLVRSKNIKKIKNVHNFYFSDLKKLKKKLDQKRFFAIIHCATHYKKNHNFDDINKMIEANLLLGNIILENKNINYCKKFINLTTVWENHDGIKNNPANLYAAYKSAFSTIINFYKKKLKNVKFYNLYLSETFGENDKRLKLFKTIKEDYKNKKTTIFLSKKIIINLVNVNDIVNAIGILLKKNLKSSDYSILNKKKTDIIKLISNFNKTASNKIKFKFNSNKISNDKILKFKNVPGWKPKNSSVKNMIDYIVGK